MTTTTMNYSHEQRKHEKIYLHPLPVRLWHWLNAVSYTHLTLPTMQ